MDTSHRLQAERPLVAQAKLICVLDVLRTLRCKPGVLSVPGLNLAAAAAPLDFSVAKVD